MAVGLIVLIPGALSGQATASERAACPSGPEVGDLGVDFKCQDCGLDYDDASRTWRWRFRSEPIVNHVDRSGPSAGKLRNQDVVVSIDGLFITTRRGGAKLASLDPDEPVEVVVRRNGRDHTFSIDPAPTCPTEARLRAYSAARGRGASVPPVPPRVVRPRARSVPAPMPVLAPRPSVSPGPLLGTRVWFGFGLSCNQCSLTLVKHEEIEALERELKSQARADGEQTDEVDQLAEQIEPLREAGYAWSFEEFPRVFSVDDGGPADESGLRRGDLLTHIDGLSLLSAEGGKRLGQVEPGQRVEFVYQRGSTVGTAKLEASTSPHPYGMAASKAYRRSLESMSRSLGRLERTEDPELLAEVVRLQAEVRAAEVAQRVAVVESIRAEQVHSYPVRYSGVISKVSVTVRSRASVVVTRDEKTGEVVITTGDATVRVKPEED